MRFIQGTFGRRSAFDPLSSDRSFRIYSTDIASSRLSVLLNAAYGQFAPPRPYYCEISPKTCRICWNPAKADLCYRRHPSEGGGFCRQRLFHGRFVCAMRADHPRIGNRLTREQFESETHLSVTTNGTG